MRYAVAARAAAADRRVTDLERFAALRLREARWLAAVLADQLEQARAEISRLSALLPPAPDGPRSPT